MKKQGLLILSFVVLALPAYSHQHCLSQLDIEYRITEIKDRLSDLNRWIPYPVQQYDVRAEKESLEAELNDLEVKKYWMQRDRRFR